MLPMLLVLFCFFFSDLKWACLCLLHVPVVRYQAPGKRSPWRIKWWQNPALSNGNAGLRVTFTYPWWRRRHHHRHFPASRHLLQHPKENLKPANPAHNRFQAGAWELKTSIVWKDYLFAFISFKEMWIFTPLLILGDQINFVLDPYWNKDKQIHFRHFHV